MCLHDDVGHRTEGKEDSEDKEVHQVSHDTGVEVVEEVGLAPVLPYAVRPPALVVGVPHVYLLLLAVRVVHFEL